MAARRKQFISITESELRGLCITTHQIASIAEPGAAFELLVESCPEAKPVTACPQGVAIGAIRRGRERFTR
jgi:hypothetical protein